MTHANAIPDAHASMLVRRPAREVYDAFVEPEHLTRFWLSAASGPLRIGEAVRWEFMVPGASADATAETLEPGRRIVLRWSDGTRVRWDFEPRTDASTRVSVVNSGLGSVKDALEATQGFAIVLCDLKATLEGGASPRLVRDKARLIEEADA